MNFYETMYVIHPALQAGRLDDIVNSVDSKIESFTENLVVLRNNTDEIIKYVENEDSKENKKYFFWKLLDKND